MDKKLRTPITAIMLIIIVVLRLFECTIIFTELFHYRRTLDFFSILEIALEVALCFTLFAKKRNNVLLIVLACTALLPFISLIIISFRASTLLFFAAYAILLVYALSLCEQTLIKADLSKIKEFANKFSFLPAVIYIVAFLCFWLKYVGIPDVFVPGMNIITALLEAVALLTLAMWLKDPYAKAAPISETKTNSSCVEEYEEAYCELGKHIILCLFTFGVWYLIWTYRTTKFLNKAPNAEQYNPTSKLLLCMFVPFYQIYWMYKHGQRIDAMSKQKKLNNSDMATLCLVLGIFIPIVACILMQDRINILCTTKAVVEEQKAADPKTEQLKEYKELFDSGVITQEEFDAKKKQLLGL